MTSKRQHEDELVSGGILFSSSWEQHWIPCESYDPPKIILVTSIWHQRVIPIWHQRDNMKMSWCLAVSCLAAAGSNTGYHLNPSSPGPSPLLSTPSALYTRWMCWYQHISTYNAVCNIQQTLEVRQRAVHTGDILAKCYNLPPIRHQFFKWYTVICLFHVHYAFVSGTW